MRPLAFFLSALFLVSCRLVSPYTITFTTPEDTLVDPVVDTLDFVISAPALAYISEVECEEAEDIELLPVITEDMKVKAAHNLPLTLLNGAPGSSCEVTVSVFDQSTTATAQASTTVVISGEELGDEQGDGEQESDGQGEEGDVLPSPEESVLEEPMDDDLEPQDSPAPAEPVEGEAEVEGVSNKQE